ncbi:cell division transport system permease protein [Evansella caseinilytica]|uniref:Cell division protein FtsX n=1 Tax=Evansella caseinilytica TaxID=1503961 RepID=A0A1H3S8Y4_9BACI|nr:permease-like cell division protein FtsX [Evansella caseinilytica]SDZ34217.1 cell division transport system permease protein [Evansella caseinilytica]
MKGRTILRHLKEGCKNLVRNGWMTFASISAVTVMLFVVGAFLMIIMNVNHFATSLEQDVEVRVFIDIGAEQEEQDELLSDLEEIPGIDSIQFVSKDEGLDSLIASLGEEGDIFKSLKEENPLNDVFVVQAEEPQETENIAGDIETLPHVDSVEYGKDIFEKLFSVTDFVRLVGLILILGLMFTAMFLIANTIKLTIIARKREIQIMKLVGATNWFIRWPFFVEGLLLGTLGAVLPISILGYGYRRFYESVGTETGISFFQFLPQSPLVYQMALLLISIGALVGVWGSMMSIRKFLKV